MRSRLKCRPVFVFALMVQLAVDALVPSGYAPQANATVLAATASRGSELFGMVARDPFYEFNTDPSRFPNAPNRIALERQASEMAAAGVRWLRMEFFADYDGTVGAGDVNWSKYDWFIRELAPKYNLKVLALLNVGLVAYGGATLRTIAFNDPADGGGSDSTDGSNHFIRVFTARAQAVAVHYGSAISAYEVINEPNISYDLWLDSGHGSAELKPERYAALLTNAYRAIKSVAPQVEVIVGGMLVGSPPEGQDHDQFDYIYQLYISSWVQNYKSAGLANRPGYNTVPWDGVALHPYFLEADKLFALCKDFVHKLRDRGDFKSKLWITEVGAQAEPPESPTEPPTKQEISQAKFVRDIYAGAQSDPELKENIPHIFWFKYEDFVPGNYTHNYGLVRLKEKTGLKEYDPSGQVFVHKLAYKTYQELALGHTLTAPMGEEQARNSKKAYFPETQQAITPEFAGYWSERGGLERFGYPISRPIVLRGYLSQFFERAIFEYHPEFEGTPNAVLLRLLGNEFTAGRNFDKADESALPPGSTYYKASGHSLGGVFKAYWEATGGLSTYGYPISEEISEVSPTNGESYTVQYFERNRFELHPEAAGTQFEVQLGLLGSNLLKTDLWWRP